MGKKSFGEYEQMTVVCVGSRCLLNWVAELQSNEMNTSSSVAWFGHVFFSTSSQSLGDCCQRHAELPPSNPISICCVQCRKSTTENHLHLTRERANVNMSNAVVLFSPDAECKRMRIHCNQKNEYLCVVVHARAKLNARKMKCKSQAEFLWCHFHLSRRWLSPLSPYNVAAYPLPAGAGAIPYNVYRFCAMHSRRKQHKAHSIRKEWL